VSAVLAQLEAQHSAAGARFPLLGEYALADPLVLLVLPVGLIVFVLVRRHGRAAGRVSLVATLPRSWRQRTGWVPAALQVAAFLLAGIALARPLRTNVEHSVHSEGVDIALVIDRSGSMQFEDLEEGKSRLTVVKEVVGEFAARRMSDRENAADSVALITFARYPRLVCPFTLDVEALQGFLAEVQLVEREEEDGTAIGVGLAKAVSVLRDSDAKSRLCVLLTDGENNVEDIPPAEATELAAEEGIRVYTIFAARFQYQRDPFTARAIPVQARVDTSVLEHMAEATGGRFFRATERAELEEIYAEIERLERTPRTEQRFEETFDLYPWFVAPALLCAFLAQLARAFPWRRLA
jgi:Ca-activated chloride channel family protein